MSDVPSSILTPTAGRDVNSSSNPDVRECFAPFIPRVAEERSPAPKQAARVSLGDVVRRELGIDTSTDANPEAGIPAPADATNDGDTDLSTEHPDEILTASVETPLPIPPQATAPEIFTWIKRSVLALTHLPEDAAELVAFWAISTWFPDALSVRPCLVITGPAHDATVVLLILRDFCRWPVLLAEFRRSHLKALEGCGRTNLISVPNLDKRTAALFGNLTNPKFFVVEGDSLTRCSYSTAIYAGEDPVAHTIQNSIHIHLTPKHAEPPRRPEWLQEHIKYVPGHLKQYRDANLGHVRWSEFVPSGLSSGTWAVGEALGSCIVGAPELQKKVVALLKTPDQRRHFEMSDTIEAVVVEAIRNLTREGRKHAYVREIAAEVNRLLEARGETVRLSPEKIGHRLKKLDLRTIRYHKLATD